MDELTKAKQAEERQDEVSVQNAQKLRQTGVGRGVGGGRPEGGVSAAVRVLGIDRYEAMRSQKIASMAPEAKKAVIAAGLSNNNTALMTIANAKPDRQAQVAEAVVRYQN